MSPPPDGHEVLFITVVIDSITPEKCHVTAANIETSAVRIARNSMWIAKLMFYSQHSVNIGK